MCVKRSVARVETHVATDEKLKKSLSKMAKDLENITYDSAEKPRLFEMRLPLLQTKAFQK